MPLTQRIHVTGGQSLNVNICLEPGPPEMLMETGEKNSKQLAVLCTFFLETKPTNGKTSLKERNVDFFKFHSCY